MDFIYLSIAIITALLSIGLNFAQRHQAKADASNLITEAAINLIEPLNKRIDDLEEIIDNLRARIQELEKENEKLKEENHCLKKKKLL